MEPDFKVKVLGKNRKIDIAIFKPGKPHTDQNLYRAVVVEKEPKIGTKGAYRMRDPEEARKEFELLEAVMAEVESCDYGLWTNGLEFFFFKKEVTRFDTKFKPIGDWPMGDDTFSTREGRSHGADAPGRSGHAAHAFRRCHNYIHGNEGMPKDAAFWQFLYLIFCKMYDEQQPRRAACLLGRPLRAVQIPKGRRKSAAHQAAFRSGEACTRTSSRATKKSPCPTGPWPSSFPNWHATTLAHRCRCQRCGLPGDRRHQSARRSWPVLHAARRDSAGRPDACPEGASGYWIRRAARAASWSRP
jgi:hypothetical protein